MNDRAQHLLALVSPERLQAVLQRMLDETEFFSDFGVRSLWKIHAEHPYTFDIDGQLHAIAYEPAELTWGMFGGNSNGRSRIWFPVNFLLVESLQKFHAYFGNDFLIECPVGSGKWLKLAEVADELSRRLISIFQRQDSGDRPIHGHYALFQNDRHWRDLLLFNDYINGDTGAGLGANHQTGWTGLVASLIRKCAKPKGDR